MSPPPTDWRQLAAMHQMILAGLLACLNNRMIPDGMREPVLIGAVQGQLDVLTDKLGGAPHPVQIIMQALSIREGALARAR
jgi:hypothetical protein